MCIRDSRRGHAAGLHGLAGEPEQGIAALVDRTELQGKQLGEVQRRIGARNPGGMQQRVLDGKGHRRGAQLGQHLSLIHI